MRGDYNAHMEFRLSNIVQVITGHTFRSAIPYEKEGNFFVAQAKSISGGELSLDFTKTSIEKTRTKGLCQKRDILLTNRGTFRAAIYEGEIENLIAASSVFILRINNRNKVLPEYLRIYLNSKPGQQKLNNQNRGATIKSLSKSSLLEISIPVPSVENQKQIISIYENYYSRKGMYQEQARLHKEIANYTINKLITS